MKSENLSREMPEVTGMERELLGTLLLKDGQAVPTVNSILTADDFYLKDHQEIYSVITDLAKRGIAPNLLSIIEELKISNKLSQRMVELVVTLGEVAFSTAYAEPWAKKIKEYSTRRKMIEFSLHLNRKAVNPSVAFEDIYLFAESTLRNINSKNDEQKSVSKRDYLNLFFDSDCANTHKYSNRKTGFTNIDEQQILSPGLYLIGATPACGKTTFAWQLLEQMAALGERCLFVSYEMARLELVTKSLARGLYKRDPKTEITAAQIRNGATSDALIETLAEQMTEENSVEIFEFRDENVDDLLRILRPYCNGKDKSPVVCVDYLQIIPPSNDVKLTTDKARIDDIVHKLKTFQRETNTTFIIISSFNRVNYYQQVSFESFKDSGNIEYTADVVWALQMYVANLIKNGASISDTRKKFEDAKMQKPRELQLKCLKNRQGNNYDCYFNYYSAHDYFTPATLAEFVANHANDDKDKVDEVIRRLKANETQQQREQDKYRQSVEDIDIPIDEDDDGKD